MEIAATLDAVKTYYGTTLQGSSDLKTDACRCMESVPDRHREILSEIEPEILERFYGCGSPIPPGLEGCTVLDLGCGTGRDVYLASRLVGPDGRVIGVDMTAEPLTIARKYRAAQAKRFGYAQPNVDFCHGRIEDLKALGIADRSVDVVISNCVINLSPEKERVFSEVFRVLKPGGELLFSDVFADRRVAPELAADPELVGECLGGAMYIEDFRRLLRAVGCQDYRVVSRNPVKIEHAAIQARVGLVKYTSLTIRAFKLDDLEDLCEDFGQVAVYRGTIPDHAHHFALDDHHDFLTGKPMLVCGNTAAMVSETRYGRYFRVLGDRAVHYGAFDCHSGSGAPAVEGPACSSGCC